MNFIKKSILVILLLSVSVTSFGQNLKKMAEKRAEEASVYVAEKMNFNDAQKAFLYEVLVVKFESNMKQTRGKELSKEEKQSIYKAANKKATTKLKAQFSSEEIKEINKYQQEANKKAKK